jgi:hypothetical protein
MERPIWYLPLVRRSPVQPGWYLPPQKDSLLAENNRFLQTRKGAENTKEKSRQCFALLLVFNQLLQLKVHTQSADFVHLLPTRYAIIRNCAEFGQDRKRGCLIETLLIFRKPSLPWAVHHVHCCLLMHMPV